MPQSIQSEPPGRRGSRWGKILAVRRARERRKRRIRRRIVRLRWGIELPRIVLVLLGQWAGAVKIFKPEFNCDDSVLELGAVNRCDLPPSIFEVREMRSIYTVPIPERCEDEYPQDAREESRETITYVHSPRLESENLNTPFK
jgi:hypothetical protein